MRAGGLTRSISCRLGFFATGSSCRNSATPRALSTTRPTITRRALPTRAGAAQRRACQRHRAAHCARQLRNWCGGSPSVFTPVRRRQRLPSRVRRSSRAICQQILHYTLHLPSGVLPIETDTTLRVAWTLPMRLPERYCQRRRSGYLPAAGVRVPAEFVRLEHSVRNSGSVVPALPARLRPTLAARRRHCRCAGRSRPTRTCELARLIRSSRKWASTQPPVCGCIAETRTSSERRSGTARMRRARRRARA